MTPHGLTATRWPLRYSSRFDPTVAPDLIGSRESDSRSWSVPFTTAPGTGIRSILAQFELARLPAERITVAHFQPPSPRLGRIRALRVERRGITIRAKWHAVPGASGYELVLTSDGASQRRIRVRGTMVTLRGIARSTAGRVSVCAVDTLREGPIVSAGYKATTNPRTRLRRLPKAPRLR